MSPVLHFIDLFVSAQHVGSWRAEVSISITAESPAPRMETSTWQTLSVDLLNVGTAARSRLWECDITSVQVPPRCPGRMGTQGDHSLPHPNTPTRRHRTMGGASETMEGGEERKRKGGATLHTFSCLISAALLRGRGRNQKFTK